MEIVTIQILWLTKPIRFNIHLHVIITCLQLPITPLRPPLPSPTMSTSSSPSVNIIKKRKRIPYTLVEASKGNKCPTPSCNGIGHVTGLYSMHYAESGCPIAAQKKKELEKVVSNVINVVLMFFISSYGTPLAQRPSHLAPHSSLFGPHGTVN